jgi:hydroxymethylglutaryl-CoA lyase
MAAGKRVQASVQSAFGCGFEGPIPQQAVLEIIKAYLDAGVRNLSLADTAGHAQPMQVEDLYGYPPVGRMSIGCVSTTPMGWAGKLRGGAQAGVVLRNHIWRTGWLSVLEFHGQCQHQDLVHSLQRWAW